MSATIPNKKGLDLLKSLIRSPTAHESSCGSSVDQKHPKKRGLDPLFLERELVRKDPLSETVSQWPPTLRYIAHGLEFNGVSHTDSLRIVRDAVVKALPVGGA